METRHAPPRDTLLVLDLTTGKVVERLPVALPRRYQAAAAGLLGANPNAIALAPDGRRAFVSHGGLNAVSVVALSEAAIGGTIDADDDEDDRAPSQVVGLIPTGWYPMAVAVRADGRQLYVTNGKSNSGPIRCSGYAECEPQNQYIWQLEKAGFLAAPCRARPSSPAPPCRWPKTTTCAPPPPSPRRPR